MQRKSKSKGTVERLHAARMTLRHAAGILGVEHSHLRRVIIGERRSDVLLGRYLSMMRDGRIGTPKHAKTEPRMDAGRFTTKNAKGAKGERS
jgi:hypothetical protein